MQTYISMLRGINVSGQKLVKMDALRKAFLDSGLKNVQTYIQSGNVIFRDGKTNPKVLEKRIKDILSRHFGFEIPVLVLELEELKKIIKNNPYQGDKLKDASFLHITFLSEKPVEESIRKIREIHYQQDEFVWDGKCIYLYCPNGYGRTRLTNTFFENKLKVSATTRNWKTSNELLAIAEKIGA